MMGRATKWFKGLFGMNKKETSSSCFHDRGNKKASSFSHSLKRVKSRGLSSNPTTTPPNISPVEAAWTKMMSPLYGYDMEQNKQAMEVAAAAIEAAKAAVELVRVTSQGRGTMLNSGREVFAAITIQTIFRSYLARKALRALKALVKVQALVRGFLVRKQTYATLHSMEALIRAQQNVRAQMASMATLKNHQKNCPSQCVPRKSQEKFGNSRNIFKVASDKKRIYVPFEPNLTDFDQCMKVVKVDSQKMSRSGRIMKCMIPSYTTSPHDNTACESLPEGRSFRESDQWRYMMRGENKYPTGQISPVFTNSCRSNAPINKAKSVCGDVYFRNENENSHNYMVNTKSFNAKMRSQSVPKQRADEFSLNELMITGSKTCQNEAKNANVMLTSSRGTSTSRTIMGWPK